MMDAAHAQSCAENVQGSAAAGGPDQVMVGNAYEHRLVDRWDALIDAHARLVLIYCRAEPYRLAALESYLSLRNEANTDACGERPYDTEAIAATLAAEALCMVCEAGALTDRRARARLLVSMEYHANRELCASLGAPELAGSPDDLIAELDRIENDRAERRERGT